MAVIYDRWSVHSSSMMRQQQDDIRRGAVTPATNHSLHPVRTRETVRQALVWEAACAKCWNSGMGSRPAMDMLTVHARRGRRCEGRPETSGRRHNIGAVFVSATRCSRVAIGIEKAGLAR